jgi:ATP-dependent protease Clp ATPase subunit
MARRVDENCSFCGRNKKEVELLVTGVGANICNFCIEQANNIVSENAKKNPANRFVNESLSFRCGTTMQKT